MIIFLQLMGIMQKCGQCNLMGFYLMMRKKNDEQVYVCSKWSEYVQQIEKHAAFMVSVVSSANGKKLNTSNKRIFG